MGLSHPEGLAKPYPLLLPVSNRNHFGSRLNAQCSFIIIYAVVYQRSATCRNRFSFESISATGTVSQHSIILMRCQFVNVNSCTGALLLCTIQCFCVPYYMLNIAIRARRGLHGTTNSELEHCCNVQRRTWLPPDENLLAMHVGNYYCTVINAEDCQVINDRLNREFPFLPGVLLTNPRMRIHCRHRPQSTMSTIDSLVECRDASTHHTIAQLDIIGGTVQQSKQNVVALSSVQ